MRRPSPKLAFMPPEIRNLIYEFALTHNGRLFCIKSGLFHTHKVGLYTERIEQSACYNSKHEFNQLKYVSRKFYHETAGLELRYNDITFGQDFDPANYDLSVASEFVNFFNYTLEPAWHNNLGKVYFRHYRGIENHTYEKRRGVTLSLEADSVRRDQVLALCENNPHLTIYWEIQGLCSNLGPDLILFGLTVYNAARGCDPEGMFNPFPVCQGFYWTNNIAIIRNGFFGGQGAPKNLKLLPQGNWYEEAWARGVKRLRNSMRFVGYHDLEASYNDVDGLGVWRKEVKKWYEDGF